MVVDASGNLYIGGTFTFAGTTRVNSIARWDGSGWRALGSGVNGTVAALAVSGNDVYAGGGFTMAGGIAATNIAKWNGSSWSSLGSGVNGSSGMNGWVNALAISEGNVYAGGGFGTAGGIAVNNIAKWDGSSWTPLGSGIGGNGYGEVYALAVLGSDVYVGSSYGLARWNGSSWLSLSSPFSTVNALAVSGGNVYAGGWTSVRWLAVGKWNGSSWTTLTLETCNNPLCGDNIYALAVSGGSVYVGGNFYNVPASGGIVKWDGGYSWSALGSGVSRVLGGDPTVCALAVSGTNLYAGGSFLVAGGGAADAVAKWDGSSWSALGSGLGGGPSQNYGYYINALAVSGGDVYAGGDFLVAGSGISNDFAKWDGSSWTALGSGMGACPDCGYYINALAVSGSDVYAGGAFTTAGGVAATNIAKWNGSGWNALGLGVNSEVYALAVSGSNLYAGGAFTTAGGIAANYIAKWNGSSWSALGSGMNGVAYALAVSGGTLYAGGRFTTAGGIAANYIAKWNGSSWLALGSCVNRPVYALAISGSALYAGGNFTTAGGVVANGIAKWNGSGWTALGSGVGPDVFGTARGVSALTAVGSDVYVGGSFNTAGGIPANGIAKWDGSGWSALGSGTDRSVTALAIDGAWRLFVGGDFAVAGTNASPFAAIANVDSLPTIAVPPPSQTAEAGTTVRFTVQANGKPPPAYQWCLNGVGNLGCAESRLVLENVTLSQSGAYTVVLTNNSGTVTSPPAMLNVIAPVARRLVPSMRLTAQAGSLLGLDYCDSLGSATGWQTMTTIIPSSNSQLQFDLSEPLPPQRFYRSWQSGTPGFVPQLHLIAMVPAITLTGNVGEKLRLDCINQIGPTDAWWTLDTVTLTNTSQLYFDTSGIGQPARLWRIVPLAGASDGSRAVSKVTGQ